MSAPENSPELPSNTIRTVVSLLLMIHIVFILITVMTGFAPLSELRFRLGRVPGAAHYAQLLSQDIQFNGPISNFGLTDASGFAVDHQCEILLNWQPGAENDTAVLAQLERLPLMPEGTWPGIRRQRLLRLAAAVALNDGNSNTESLLPDSISKGLLNSLPDANPNHPQHHRFRCTARLMPHWTTIGAESNPLAPRWLTTRYEADVLGGGQQWALNKVSARGEVTQVDQGNRAPQGPQPPPSNQNLPGGGF